MLIAATTTSRVEKLDVQARFLEILPPIERQARIAFRNLRGAEREERIAEVTALAYCMFHRLAVRGMLDMAYPTALARYAIRQTWAGRGAGVQLNVHDVTSAYCQRATGVRVKSLEQVEATNDEWKEMLSDKRATPAEIASCRIDFADWLRLLSAPLRRVAKTLASGESTLIAARQLAFHPAGSRRSGENCSSLGNGFKARLRNPPRNWRALSAERGRWGVVSMENWHSPGRNLCDQSCPVRSNACFGIRAPRD